MPLVAHHEAGHAIAILKLGGALHHVTIVPKDERDLDGNLICQTAGHVSYHLYGPSSRDTTERGILISLSGAAAEHIIEPDRADSGSDPDLGKALDRASEIVPAEQLRGFISAMIKRAVALVARNRREVGLVARALLERGTLGGSEVRALIERKSATEMVTRPGKENGPAQA
jgi:ATP-dependent Zn protease